MASRPIPSRQVHLDFHTSEHIPAVGSRFDPKQFQEALQVARVNQINVFAKCHHSWSYYPTRIGKRHPTLQIDLLGQQIAACHEIGVQAPIYFTVGWSATEAEEHPEWCVRHRDGRIAVTQWDFEAPAEAPRPPFSWKFLCPSGDYRALILAQTEELCQLYPVDGFWYDINCLYPLCYCENCRRGMAQEGIDLDDPEAVCRFNVRKWKQFFQECTRVIRSYHPEASLFFNGTTQLGGRRNEEFRMYEYNTKQDLEDLPTTWGGYDKLPLRAKFFHLTGQPLVAMSGKFHTSWGEFGGFKPPEAMRYEAAAMISFGAACNFGDQLHPLGEMDLETYRSIGHAYAYVEQIEDYGIGGRPVATLGLWRSGSEADDEGVARMLLETQTDFVVVDPDAEGWDHEAIILAGGPCLTSAQAERLNRYARAGGGLLVLGESALDASRQRFLLEVGADYLGPARYDVDYLVVGEALAAGLVRSPFLNYEPTLRTRPHPGTEVLATLREPYFSRTYGRYCSHQNTPYRPETADHPGALRRGNVVFLPQALGRLYYTHGARVHRDLFSNALRLIHRNPMIRVHLPSAGRVSLLHQPQHHRYVAHLLYGPPLQRGRCLVIEDLVPLYNVRLEVRLPVEVSRIYLVPTQEPLAAEKTEGTFTVIVPEVRCHQAVVLEYGTGAGIGAA